MNFCQRPNDEQQVPEGSDDGDLDTSSGGNDHNDKQS